MQLPVFEPGLGVSVGEKNFGPFLFVQDPDRDPPAFRLAQEIAVDHEKPGRITSERALIQPENPALIAATAPCRAAIAEAGSTPIALSNA
jgi:hypothetical protein